MIEQNNGEEKKKKITAFKQRTELKWKGTPVASGMLKEGLHSSL